MNSNRIQENGNYENNYRVETGIGPLVDKVLNTILDRITSDNFREQLTNKIIDPVTNVVNEKIKPYLYISIILYLVLVVLLTIIIYLLVKKK